MINGRGLPVNASLLDIVSALVDIIRRAVDGTVVPLFVDYTNQRVIIGSTTSTAPNSILQVNGDIQAGGSTTGLILTDANGSGKTVRVKAIYDPGSQNWTLDLNSAS